VREVLEREEKMEKKEPSELAVKIAETINRETQLNAYAPWIAELVSDSGLAGGDAGEAWGNRIKKQSRQLLVRHARPRKAGDS